MPPSLETPECKGVSACKALLLLLYLDSSMEELENNKPEGLGLPPDVDQSDEQRKWRKY